MPKPPMILTIALLSTLPAAAQWETSQGGNSRRDGRVETFGPLAPRPGWTRTDDTQFAIQPVVGDGLVVYTRVFDWRSFDGSIIEAVDLETGALRWSATLPSINGLYNAPIAIRDGKVYVTRAHFALVDELLHALDAQTGALLWTAQDAIQAHFFTSPAFLSDGDLIVNGSYVIGEGWFIQRVDHRDGSTVWIRPPPEGTNTELAGGAVFDDRFYFVHELGGKHEVARLDTNSGLRLYGSRPEGNGRSESHGNLTIGPDGTIYWPYGHSTVGGSVMIALRDTGTALVERWRAPIRDLWASGQALGADGSIFTFSRDGEVLRLAPEDGRVLDRSAPVPLDFITARPVVDAGGHLFVVFQGQGAVPARLDAYAPDLELLWSIELGLSPTAGPTLAEDGRLIVSTARDVVRTFQLKRVRPAEGPCAQAAQVTLRPGSGVNPLTFRALDLPRWGSRLRLEIDTGSFPPTGIVGALFYASAASGPLTRHGEVLVDPTSPLLFHMQRQASTPTELFTFSLPHTSRLCGLRASGQAFLLGPSGLELSNGLDLVFGD